ncbi:hypothetical protein ABKV19_012365 [Rosa sericea]
MAEKLSSIHVPEDEQAAIIEKLLQLVEVAFPGLAIIVHVWDVTVYYLDNASSLGPGDLVRSLWATTLFDEDDQMTVDRYAMESTETYEARTKIFPATNLCIDGLERVRFDSLETNIRHMPCAICKERLDHFAVEEGTDQQLMITRLPCSHLYHVDCIAQWLESNHLCPLCRYPLPTVEEAGESSQPLHCNMLVMSAGGILTTAACFALQMIEAKLKMKISDHLLYFVPLVAMYSSKFL